MRVKYTLLDQCFPGLAKQCKAVLKSWGPAKETPKTKEYVIMGHATQPRIYLVTLNMTYLLLCLR